MVLSFLVDKQIITRVDKEKVVRDSMNYLRAQFQFSPDWTGQKTAVFKSKSGAYNVLIDDDGSCLVPWEVLVDEVVEVSAFCGALITANVVKIITLASGYTIGEEGREPTPDVFTQIMEKLSEIEQAEIDPEEVEQIIANYLTENNYVTDTDLNTAIANFVTESDVNAIVAAYVDAHKSEWQGSEVSVTAVQQTGTKIAEIEIDGTTTSLYAPEGGSGSGDMLASVYDPNGTVANAGGIEEYVEDEVSGKMDATNPTGTGALSINRKANTTVGVNSVTEGSNCEASGNNSHAEGDNTKATGIGAHVEGNYAAAGGAYSHAEGNSSASGAYSHAQNYYTTAQNQAQTAIGKYNDNRSNTLFEVGNGTANDARSNAFEVYSDGSLSTDNGTTKVKLEDVVTADITNPQSGDVLVYDGEKWGNGNSATDNIDVSTGLTRIYDINHIENPFTPGNRFIILEDGVLTMNAPASGNIFPGYHIYDSDIVDHHGICKIRLHVASVGGTWRVQFRTTTTGGGSANIRMLDITEPGTYDLVLRLDELTVYHQYDGNGVNVALINISHDVSIVVDEFDTFVGIATNLAGNKLTENLMNTNARVTRLENNNSVVLSSPSGDKFMLQLDSNNQIRLIPIIPNNVLYLGNSLLLGFTTHGMASYDTTDDYYALINDYLTDKGVTLTTDRLAGSMFETAESDTTVTNFLNTLLLPKLSNDTQLVIIQLGDNTTTALAREKFKTSCATLIEFIFAHAPNARIAWAGTWYENDTVNEIITNTCKQYSITRIPLNDLSIVDGNMSHIGATYIDGQGNEQTITTAGVASHPSPQGMKAIADRIISTLFE